MAGEKLMLNNRVDGSTILEVIVAMVMILAVFTIAMMISANVMRSSLSVKKIRAEAILHDVLIKAGQNMTIETQTFTIGDFKVSQEVKSYEGNSALTAIKLSAIDANLDTVATIQKVLLNR